MSKISIIDTNSGNIKSVANALNFLGCNFEILSKKKFIISFNITWSWCLWKLNEQTKK